VSQWVIDDATTDFKCGTPGGQFIDFERSTLLK